MKKIIILALMTLLLPFAGRVGGASAQTRFGYLDYDAVLRQMPEYAEALQRVSALKVKYEQEATRGEEEFQRKFSEFLQGQKDFPENILVKRQAELQNLMEAGIKFRQDAQQLLSKAERELMSGVKVKLNEAIHAVATEMGYGWVLNTGGDSCPYINPDLGDDVTHPVLQHLGVEEPEKPASQEVTDLPNETNVQ